MLQALIMNDIKFAIKNVVKKRTLRGATGDSLMKYMEHLKVVWKNSPEILKFIERQKKHI